MQLSNTTADNTSNDGPYFNLDDFDKIVYHLDSGWLIESSSESRITLVCGGEIRIFVSMIIVSPRQCDLAIKFYHGNLLVFGFETPLNTNDRNVFSYDIKENVWPFILAHGLAKIFFIVLYSNSINQIGVIENDLHFVNNHDQVDMFNRFLADVVNSIDNFDKESVFLGMLSAISYGIAYTNTDEFIQDVYDAGLYEIAGTPEGIAEFVSLHDAANCLITSSSTSYLSRDDIRCDVGSISSTAPGIMLLPRDVRALRMCLGSGALDPGAIKTLTSLWSNRSAGDLQQFFSYLTESLSAEVVASGLADFARAATCFDPNHPLASFYAALGVLVRVLADTSYESSVLEGMDQDFLIRKHGQIIELLSSELSLNSSGRLHVPDGDVKAEEMSSYLCRALKIYKKEGHSFLRALNDNDLIEGHTVNVVAAARALLATDLIGDSHILYNLLNDNFSKKRGAYRILKIRVKSVHTLAVSPVEYIFNKVFIEMCGIDSRMTESDQVSAVRILLKAFSED